MEEKETNLKSTVVKLWQEKQKPIIIAIAAVVALIIIIGIIRSLGQGTSTTTGNLWNRGMVASKGSRTYYLKYEDGAVEGIYRVGRSGKNGERVTTDYGYYMNIDGNHIYFVDGDTLVRIKRNGKDKETLVRNVSDSKITVHNGWVYYSKGGSFHRVKTNGKDSERITNRSVESYQIEGRWIYYTTSNDSGITISKMRLDGSKNERIDGDLTTPFFYVNGNTIYYIEADYNLSSGDGTIELGKMRTNGKNKSIVVEFEEDIIGINMNQDGIYYVAQNEDYDTHIYFMNYKGKNKRNIIEVDNWYAKDIFVLDNFIYYVDKDENDELTMHRVRTNGKDKITI